MVLAKAAQRLVGVVVVLAVLDQMQHQAKAVMAAAAPHQALLVQALHALVVAVVARNREPQVLGALAAVVQVPRQHLQLLAAPIRAAVAVVEVVGLEHPLQAAPESSFCDIPASSPSPTPVVVLHLPLQQMATLRSQLSLQEQETLSSQYKHGTLRIS
jgi:hypothetical protein